MRRINLKNITVSLIILDAHIDRNKLNLKIRREDIVVNWLNSTYKFIIYVNQFFVIFIKQF